jgi:hypothetical protein
MAYVQIDLSDIDDDELIDELESRDYVVTSEPYVSDNLIDELNKINELNSLGINYTQELADIIYKYTYKIMIRK